MAYRTQTESSTSKKIGTFHLFIKIVAEYMNTKEESLVALMVKRCNTSLLIGFTFFLRIEMKLPSESEVKRGVGILRIEEKK